MSDADIVERLRADILRTDDLDDATVPTGRLVAAIAVIENQAAEIVRLREELKSACVRGREAADGEATAQHERDTLQASLAAMREALEFYASPHGKRIPGTNDPFLADIPDFYKELNFGDVATRALASAPGWPPAIMALAAIAHEFIAQLGPDGYYPTAGEPRTRQMREALAALPASLRQPEETQGNG